MHTHPIHTSSTGEFAFGKKGRPASPGKPRIPPMATVEYDLQLVALPGREVEIIDLLDFDENAPASDDRCVRGWTWCDDWVVRTSVS
jgi:hypothetical protein